ncbi:MAG: response regulator [Xenococcaceae cyanobacterium MO_188.B29]|nr:response regulator [Xenococcaceae cyanobacterium MO_188.B29]
MKSINILIVEDEKVSAETLALNLKRYEYKVLGIVNSGIQAIEKVAETQPDLILMDIVLKGTIDGIVTSKKIQATYNIPIIYLSSCSDRDTLKRARETKPKGYLIKPYKFEDLKATIETILQHQDPIKSNLKRINRKVKLASFKVKQIAHQNFYLPSLSDRDRSIERAKYRDRLPQLSQDDTDIVSNLKKEGVYITSLPELGLPHTKRLIKELILLHPHLYTLSNLKNWREGIPGLRKFLHTEILLWGLGERLLDIVENYIGLPLLFHGVDLRRDAADAPITDARQWHRDIDDERMVKVIVYLNNVGRTGGPFEYIPRSFTKEVAISLGYTSGFVSEQAIAKVVPPQNWQTCTAKAGSIIITDPCNVFHRAKPAKRNRYSITFGYTSRIPKLYLSEFQLSPQEWNRITPQLSKRQIACLRRSKL